MVTSSHVDGDEGDEDDGKMARALARRFTATGVGRIAERALKKENEKGRRRRRRFGGRLKQCGRSDNAGVTGLRRIHGPWTRMDLNENLLINNKQARARSRLPFPRDTSLSSLFFLLSLDSLCFVNRTRMERPKGWDPNRPRT